MSTDTSVRRLDRLLDLGSRRFWHVVGRRVDLAGREAWLDAPVSSASRVAGGWVREETARHGGAVEELGVPDPAAGLLPSTEALDGPGFEARRLRPEVRDFYEHTAAWQLRTWSEWAPLFWPGGEIVARFWGRRVEQLALPMRPLEAARGMDSQVVPIRDAGGTQVSAAWIRTLRGSGRTVFSGAYSVRTLPGAPRPSVHVAFPLESGNVQVFLRPSITDDGGLVLDSPRGAWGENGAYVVVRDGGDHAARVPVHERFHVYVDSDGVLRTDHDLRIGRARAMRLHYELTPSS
jgi:hypothetical protein